LSVKRILILALLIIVAVAPTVLALPKTSIDGLIGLTLEDMWTKWGFKLFPSSLDNRAGTGTYTYTFNRLGVTVKYVLLLGMYDRPPETLRINSFEVEFNKLVALELVPSLVPELGFLTWRETEYWWDGSGSDNSAVHFIALSPSGTASDLGFTAVAPSGAVLKDVRVMVFFMLTGSTTQNALSQSTWIKSLDVLLGTSPPPVGSKTTRLPHLFL
jgi:hypothetical protein